MLLRQPKTNPKISACANVYGPHNYDSTPFVLVNMETFVHDKPKRQRTFAEHSRRGFVLGTSFDHYRAWTMWLKDTRATRVSATVFHKHKSLTNPAVTPSDRIIVTAKTLVDEIKGCMPHHISATSLKHFERLGNILKQSMPQTDAPPTTFPIPQSPPTTPLGRGPHTPPQQQNTPLVFPPIAPATVTPPPRIPPPPKVVPPPRVAADCNAPASTTIASPSAHNPA